MGQNKNTLKNHLFHFKYHTIGHDYKTPKKLENMAVIAKYIFNTRPTDIQWFQPAGV